LLQIYDEIKGHGSPIVVAQRAIGDTTFRQGCENANQLKDQFTVICMMPVCIKK
jgi:hypothetical protein